MRSCAYRCGVEIRRLHNGLKATSIFVTHDQVEAMTLADMVVVMNAGRIEQSGGPTEVYRLPATRLRGHLHWLACHELAAWTHCRPGHRRDQGWTRCLPSRGVRLQGLARTSTSASGPRT